MPSPSMSTIDTWHGLSSCAMTSSFGVAGRRLAHHHEAVAHVRGERPPACRRRRRRAAGRWRRPGPAARCCGFMRAAREAPSCPARATAPAGPGARARWPRSSAGRARSPAAAESCGLPRRAAPGGCGMLLRMSDIRAISSRQADFGRMSGGGNRWHGVHAARASGFRRSVNCVFWMGTVPRQSTDDAALGTVPKVSRISNTTRGRRIQSMLAHHRVALLLEPPVLPHLDPVYVCRRRPAGLEVAHDDVHVAVVIDVAHVERGVPRVADFERVPGEHAAAWSVRARPATAASPRPRRRRWR